MAPPHPVGPIQENGARGGLCPRSRAGPWAASHQERVLGSSQAGAQEWAAAGRGQVCPETECGLRRPERPRAWEWLFSFRQKWEHTPRTERRCLAQEGERPRGARLLVLWARWLHASLWGRGGESQEWRPRPLLTASSGSTRSVGWLLTHHSESPGRQLFRHLRSCQLALFSVAVPPPPPSQGHLTWVGASRTCLGRTLSWSLVMNKRP